MSAATRAPTGNFISDVRRPESELDACCELNAGLLPVVLLEACGSLSEGAGGRLGVPPPPTVVGLLFATTIR